MCTHGTQAAGRSPDWRLCVRDRDNRDAARLKANAPARQAAGAAMMVMEMVPAMLEGAVTAGLDAMATVGIGAGPDCNGQALVHYDVLGIFPGKVARFVHSFFDGGTPTENALARYVDAVTGLPCSAALVLGLRSAGGLVLVNGRLDGGRKAVRTGLDLGLPPPSPRVDVLGIGGVS